MTQDQTRPVVLCAPEPRPMDTIFTPAARALLKTRYEVIEAATTDIDKLDDERLAAVQYLVGQPMLSDDLLSRLTGLRCLFNVEGNFTPGLPYARMFERGIHVVSTSSVFALPVAEMGIGLALALGRGIVEGDQSFRDGREIWGRHGNTTTRQLTGAEVGIIGFGDLGRALHRLLQGFGTQTRVYDPWLPDAILREAGVEPASLDSVLRHSDFVFIMASATSENGGFLGADAFAAMRPGAALILLSRADVVDFDALMASVRSGHIRAASDVFPEEPLAAGHPARVIDGFIRSAHRAGGIPLVLLGMGDMILDDMALMDRGLPPMRCKRAERETVSRLRSRQVR